MNVATRTVWPSAHWSHHAPGIIGGHLHAPALTTPSLLTFVSWQIDRLLHTTDSNLWSNPSVHPLRRAIFLFCFMRNLPTISVSTSSHMPVFLASERWLMVLQSFKSYILCFCLTWYIKWLPSLPKPSTLHLLIDIDEVRSLEFMKKDGIFSWIAWVVGSLHRGVTGLVDR